MNTTKRKLNHSYKNELNHQHLKSLSHKKKHTVDAEELEYIYKIMAKITSTHDLDAVAKDIVRIMSTALDCIGGALLIVDKKGEVLRPFTYSQLGVFIEKVIPLLSKPFEEHLFDLKNPQNYVTRTVTEKRIFIGDKYEKFMCPVLSPFVSKMIQKFVRMKTIVTTPTIINGEVVGVLMIGFREKELSARQRKLLKLFADQCAVAINNAQKYEEIEAQYKQIKQLLQQQSDFITVSTHELRTPLNIALLHSQEIIEKVQKGNLNPAKILAELAVVQGANQRLHRVLEKIFDVQRYDGNSVEFCSLETNISEYLYKQEKQFSEMAQNASHQFILENKLSKHCVLTIDIEEITKMLIHLLQNAIIFSDKETTIVLRAIENTEDVILSINDNGQGIPDQSKKIIFEKFQGNHIYQSQGIGLGLYICKKIAELHKGEIWVEDNSPQGSQFFVRIPKKQNT